MQSWDSNRRSELDHVTRTGCNVPDLICLVHISPLDLIIVKPLRPTMAAPDLTDAKASAPKVTMITMDSLSSIKRERDEPMTSTSPSTATAIDGPGPTTTTYTSLRRSTRSSRASTSTIDTSVKAEPPASPIRSLDLSSYAYTPIATPPRKRVKREHDSLSTPGADGDVKPAVTPQSGKKAKPFPQLALEKPHPEPARWREQYRLIERMRKGIVAPVDDMWVSLISSISLSTLRSTPRSRVCN